MPRSFSLLVLAIVFFPFHGCAPKSEADALPVVLTAVGGNTRDGRVYGTLSTLDQTGQPGGLKLSPDEVERFYVEGRTLASLVWRMDGLRQTDFPDPLTVEFRLRAFRAPYGNFKTRVRGVLMVRNAITNSCSEPIPFAMNQARRVTSLAIPRRFVADGSLEIIIKGDDRGVYVGAREQDLCLVLKGAKQTAPNNAADAPVNDPADLTNAPYAAAISACQRVWNKYEAAIFSFDDPKRKTDGNNGTKTDSSFRGIFVDEEFTLANTLNHELKQCLAAMQVDVMQEKNPETLLEAATIHALLGQDDQTLRLLEAAANRDEAYKGAFLRLRGITSARAGRPTKAYEDLRAAVRLLPDDVESFQMLKLVCGQLDVEFPKDLTKAALTRSDGARQVRTIPWRTIYALDKSVKRLEKSVPIPQARR